MNLQSLIIKHPSQGLEARIRRFKDSPPPDAPITLNGVGVQLVNPANVPETERPCVILGYGNTQRLEPYVIGSLHEVFTVRIFAIVNETPDKDLVVRSGDMKSLIDLIIAQMRSAPIRSDFHRWDVQLESINTGSSIGERGAPSPYQFMDFSILFEYEIAA